MATEQLDMWLVDMGIRFSHRPMELSPSQEYTPEERKAIYKLFCEVFELGSVTPEDEEELARPLVDVERTLLASSLNLWFAYTHHRNTSVPASEAYRAVDFTDEDRGKNLGDCAICMEQLVLGVGPSDKEVVDIECGADPAHLFHRACLNQYFAARQRYARCPTCRRNLNLDGTFVGMIREAQSVAVHPVMRNIIRAQQVEFEERLDQQNAVIERQQAEIDLLMRGINDVVHHPVYTFFEGARRAIGGARALFGGPVRDFSRRVMRDLLRTRPTALASAQRRLLQREAAEQRRQRQRQDDFNENRGV